MSAPTVVELRWGWPMLAKKAHVFPTGLGMPESLCGRWGFGGPLTPLGDLGDKPGRDDCRPCWRAARDLPVSTPTATVLEDA